MIMKRIAFLLGCIYCFTACNNEIMDGPDEIIPDVTTPQIELFMPDSETVNVYSTATASENMIDAIWVLAFNSAGVKKWAEEIDGSRIVGNGNATQLLPQLKPQHVPVDGDSIVCFANVDPNPDTTSVTMSTINTCFKAIMNDYYYGTERLPMYGAFKWSSNDYTCEMKRIVAKIQVQMGTSVSDVTGNFTAENVTYKLWIGGKGGYVKPTNPLTGIPGSLGYYSTPEIYLMMQNSAITEKNSNIYLFEYPTSTRTYIGASIRDSVFHPDRQHIILTKTSTTPGVPTTYYRLDFYDPITKKFFDTKRNHHYLFTITKVRSEGYHSLEEAQMNPGSNIEYTIQVNDAPSAPRVISNGQYAIVTYGDYKGTNKDTIVVYTQGSAATTITFLSAQYKLPAGSSFWSAGTTTNTNSIEVEPAPSFTLVAPSPAKLTNSITPIQINVSAGNSPDYGTLTIRLGNITHKVAILRRVLPT